MKSLFRPLSVRAEVHHLTEEMIVKYIPQDAIVYDIGCGQKPFAKFLKDKVKSHIGVDLADGFYKPDQVDIIGSAYDVPVEDGIADAVISSQVIEHLEHPLKAIDESYRILKNGGLLFLSFPFLYPIHAEPRDFMRYSEYYLKQEIAGDRFEVLEIKKIGGFWYLIGFYITIYLQNFDKSFIKKLHLITIVNRIIMFLFRIPHEIEGLLINQLKEGQSNLRNKWTINYVCLLKKRG